MRVCIISPSILKTPPKYGGAIETFSYELGKNLVKQGNTVILITRNDFTRTWEAEPNFIIKSFKIPKNSMLRGILYNFKILLSLLNQNNIDIIHTQGTSSFLSAYLLSKYLKIPVVHTEHVYYPWIRMHSHSLKKRIKYPIELLLGRFTLSNAENLIVSTEIMKRSLESNNSTLKNKIMIIPQGIDPQLFNHEIDPQWLHNKYKITKSDRVILYVGRIIPEKNLGVLINAFMELIKEFKNIKLLLVGPKSAQFPDLVKKNTNSKYFYRLKNQVRIKNLQKAIFFTGPIQYEKIPYFFAGCDVFVQPSLLETFGRSLFEAIAVGTPFICRVIGSKPPNFLPEASGICLKEMTSENLLKALKEILKQPKFRLEALKAAEIIQSRYNWITITKSYLEIYKNAIKNFNRKKKN